MRIYTYNKRFAAHYGASVVTIPDQVAEDQRGWDISGQSFPALRANGQSVRVRLDGDSYGLHTSGTGDARVTSGGHKANPAGRPATDSATGLIRKQVMLDQASVDALTALGDGNLSLGVRRAAKR